MPGLDIFYVYLDCSGLASDEALFQAHANIFAEAYNQVFVSSLTNELLLNQQVGYFREAFSKYLASGLNSVSVTGLDDAQTERLFVSKKCCSGYVDAACLLHSYSAAGTFGVSVSFAQSSVVDFSASYCTMLVVLKQGYLRAATYGGLLSPHFLALVYDPASDQFHSSFNSEVLRITVTSPSDIPSRFKFKIHHDNAGSSFSPGWVRQRAAGL